MEEEAAPKVPLTTAPSAHPLPNTSVCVCLSLFCYLVVAPHIVLVVVVAAAKCPARVLNETGRAERERERATVASQAADSRLEIKLVASARYRRRGRL